MNQINPSFWEVVVKTAVTHTVTYFIIGLMAYTIFDYAALYASTSLNLLMRQTREPLVMAGPLLQPIRGMLFGVVFYLLREVIFRKRNGWLLLWLILLSIGIIGTFGPTPGSLEGMIYTVLPLSIHLISLPEVVLQSFILSVGVFYWVNHAEKRWLNWIMGITCFVVLLLPAIGFITGQH